MITLIREWLISLVLVSLLISVMQTLVPDGTMQKILQVVSGLALLAVLLQPFVGDRAFSLSLEWGAYEKAIEQQSRDLEKRQQEDMAQIIQEKTESYILDKAEELGSSVSVQIQTKEEENGVPVPFAAELTGTYSEVLSCWIAEALGIQAERQVWYETEN